MENKTCQTQRRSMSPLPKLRIVLMGKNELDNAQMGNLILGRDAFYTEAFQACEKEVSERVRGQVGDRHVTIINPPDLFHPDLTEPKISARVKECMDLSAPGPHVFILVLQPDNFSEEDRSKVKSVLNRFSHEAVNYTIVLNTVRSARHVSASFRLMIEECKIRHHMFRFDQNPVVKLFEMVDTMMKENGGKYLTCKKPEHMPGTSVHPEGNHAQKRGREDDLAEDEERQKKRREETEIIQLGQGVMVQVQHKFEERLKCGWSSPTLTNYIRTSIQNLQKKPTQKTTIGVFGQTGCGKSSLLNAILGETDLLPTGTLEACTSVIIQVEATTEDNNYRATIDFISEKEWYKELQGLLGYLKEDNKERDESICKMAKGKIEALYGQNASRKKIHELMSHPKIGDWLRLATISFSHCEASALSEEIRPFIRHYEDDLGKLYWPIVKAVKIEVPKQKELPENIVLVDLPGAGDCNQTRDEMWKQMLSHCTAVWIVSDINRVASDKIAWGILEESGMTDMVQGGECSSITFICTKTDNMGPTQHYMRSQKLTDEDLQVGNNSENSEKKRKCILHRNSMAKDKVKKKANEECKKWNINHNITTSVFTVSSHEFWSKELLEQKDTEILCLREALKSFNNSYTRQMASQFFSSASGIMYLIQASKTRDIHVDKSKLYNELTKKLEGELMSLRKNRLKPCYYQLEKCLSDGVQKAAEKCVNITLQQVQVPPGKDGRGYHQTLSALCRNKGFIRQNDGETKDLNKALAKVMHNSIKEEFNALFLNEGKKEQSVQERINEFSICSISISEGYSKPEAMIHILNFLEGEEAKLKEKAHGHIVKTKKHMYASITNTIKEEMTPGYIKAEEQIGTRSMTVKIRVLKDHAESVKHIMFDSAKRKMLDLFNQLMDQIESEFRQTLQNTMDHALTEPHFAFSIDVSSEIQKMEELSAQLSTE